MSIMNTTSETPIAHTVKDGYLQWNGTRSNNRTTPIDHKDGVDPQNRGLATKAARPAKQVRGDSPTDRNVTRQQREKHKVKMAYIYISGPPEGPIKVGYTVDLELRSYHLERDFKMPMPMRASWPVTHRVAMIAERYAHFLLRDSHYHREWFHASMEEASVAIIKAVAAAETGMPMMPSIWRAGQAIEMGEKVPLYRAPPGSLMRIEAVLNPGEVRSDFLRCAMEAELKRRERVAKPKARD